MKGIVLACVLVPALATPGMAAELDYSTYLGGSGDDEAYSIAVDQSRAMYLAGETTSFDFPTLSPYQASWSWTAFTYVDVFVTKISSGGSSLVYSTYLGGTHEDGAAPEPDLKMGVAVDSAGCAYVTGKTGSTDFPTVNSYQPSKNGSNDVFVTKLSPAGSSLDYSTYLGGWGNEMGYGIWVDQNTNAYITGYTASNDFPTLNAYQASNASPSNDDAFFTKLAPSGDTVYYSSYLGGTGIYEGATGILADEIGRVYVTGYTNANDFPTQNPYDPALDGYQDAFLTLFDMDGSSLLFSTYLGGASYDRAFGLALDQNRNPCITGDTTSVDFPTFNPYQASLAGNSDAFATKFNYMSSRLIFSTYLGGQDSDTGRAVAMDPAGFVFITGNTSSGDFPIEHPFQAEFNLGTDASNPDAFVTELCCMGNCLIYSSFLGGADEDRGYGIQVDSEGITYVAGATNSANFPVAGAYQASRAGEYDAFAAKIGHTPSRFVIADGDYNGDGTSDPAVFRPQQGLWGAKDITRIFFGASRDIPVAGDYDGDGTTDAAIFREATGLWAVKDLTRLLFGTANLVPVPGDYNGDGRCDPAFFKTSNHLWNIPNITTAYFGLATDFPVPGDYNGDGIRDIALYRGASGFWTVRGITNIYFGRRIDLAIPADYDGDGTWGAAIYRPGLGMWAIRGVTRAYLGNCANAPVPADYDGNHTDDIATFRSSAGLWAIRDTTRFYFGNYLDTAVAR